MSQFFYIHPDNPQQRLINQAVDIVRKGGVYCLSNRFRLCPWL
ncbi:YciO family [Salmonella enterica subsp. enterica]|uniref:YciO family n=1 Tax=Salmonella enterica I TaxID=59201 RepID=A0A379W9N8_SALET|nr:YciO family [Salmonella enterica subsp. enterica]